MKHGRGERDDPRGDRPMAGRGVTRPMALQPLGLLDGEGGGDDGGDGGGDGDGNGGGGHGDSGGGHPEPYSDARRAMLRRHHEHTLWVPWTLLLLGVWTALAPFHLGYENPAQWVDPSGGRGVWFSSETHTALRASLTTWSDVVSGLLLVVCAWRALRPDRPRSLWIACGVGAWLSAAPVLLWAPTSAAYLNDTLVGMLVIALTILVPGMPNMILYMRMGPPVPPGWSYNPSSWPQRWIMIVAGFAGYLASRHLAMYQLGYSEATAWDPFFGDQTRQVLDSSMSHSLPVSDAALGALAYTFEFLMGYMGSPSRWRTMPWMVTLFGILVIPLGLVHIVLVISQPVVVGAWCSFCLLAAAIMLPMIPLEVDEVVAMGQHLVRSRRRGVPFWKAFWKGGPPDDDAQPDERSPALVELPERPGAVLRASCWGLSLPWSLVAVLAVGVALVTVPDLAGVEGPAASVFHLGGSLAVVIAGIALGEVLRALRFLLVPLGAAVALLPFVLDGASSGVAWGAAVAGLALALLALPRGPVHERYGSWQRWIR